MVADRGSRARRAWRYAALPYFQAEFRIAPTTEAMQSPSKER